MSKAAEQIIEEIKVRGQFDALFNAQADRLKLVKSCAEGMLNSPYHESLMCRLKSEVEILPELNAELIKAKAALEALERGK